MTVIKFVPEKFRDQLSKTIAKGESENARQIIEDNNIDVDSYIDDEYYATILMRVLVSYGYEDRTSKLEMLRYFLEKGANPNIYTKSGYNCLHIAAQRENLIPALDLFLEFGGDVNLPDNDERTPIYWPIQGFSCKKKAEGEEISLNVIEKMLLLGADLDYKNNNGLTPRKWLERVPDELKQLVEKCERENPIYRPSGIIRTKFPIKYKYPEIVKYLEQSTLVQKETDRVEAEMMQKLKMLKNEAFENRNANYRQKHKEAALFISKTLIDPSCFTKRELSKIGPFAKKLMDAENPCLEDDVYEYLTDQICIYHLKKSMDVSQKKKWWKFWKE